MIPYFFFKLIFFLLKVKVNRAKIEHLKLRKRYIKYTYSESSLDGLLKTLILLSEVTKFKSSRWCRLVSTASVAKTEGKFIGQFLWNDGTKTNPLNTACSTAGDTQHIKKWAQSVLSSRSIAIILYRTKCPKKRGDSYSEPKLTISTT